MYIRDLYNPYFQSNCASLLSDIMQGQILAESDRETYTPAFDIVKLDESKLQISIAVAGFSKDEIEVTQTENWLLVRGNSSNVDTDVSYLHRGINGRNFKQFFKLEAHTFIKDAELREGILKISLCVDIPEDKQTRCIKIKVPK